MIFEKDTVAKGLSQWESALKGYALPAWEDFPALPLYMDQVIFLLNGYLSLSSEGRGEDKAVTPAMINNYVKMKIVPPPVKKRYERLHLAYLVMVCVLKQSMNTGDIKRLVPAGLPQGEIKALYAAFTRTVKDVQEDFCRAYQEATRPVLGQDDLPAAHLVFQFAVAANLCMQATEQLMALGREDGAEAPEP